MKIGTATIDITEYDRLMKVERDFTLEVNKIKEANTSIVRSVIGILENNGSIMKEIEDGVTSSGYSWVYKTNHGNVTLGKGSKIILLNTK